MAFQKKTWLARLGQGLNKFIFNGGSKVTLDSSPDVVTQEGTPLSAENMNDLEDRIDDAITSLMESTDLSGSINVYTTNFTVQYGNFCKRAGWVICAFSAQALTTGSYIVAIDGLPRSATSHYGFGTGGELYVIDNNGANNSCRIRINRSNTNQNFYIIMYPMLTDEV